ncbi:MAG: hypothetical protein KME05_24805 [Gloeocapsa sp. UFS-A4-WI-NPMV-4B04]|jgi:hypothetical protein|nr:hypothetical protein [Gloeocapsa sp. UFS-A4-WI-NPMV-4B04]
MNSYAVLLGTDKLIGTNGVLSLEQNGKSLEFFRIRDVFSQARPGSALTIDADIKDTDGTSEIKLANNAPVVIGAGLRVQSSDTQLLVARDDGTVVFKAEQVEPDQSFRPATGPLKDFFEQNPVGAVIRITGNFYAGSHLIKSDARVDPTDVPFGNVRFETLNASAAESGLRLTPFGFSF